jgi:hypothetical protein
MSIGQIVEGTVNNVFGLEETLFKIRIEVCRNNCPLLKINSIFGEICNHELCLNPNTNETSEEDKPNFYRGCGCVLGSKTRVPEAHCPAKKW